MREREFHGINWASFRDRLLVLSPFLMAATLALSTGQRFLRANRQTSHLSLKFQGLEREADQLELVQTTALVDGITQRFTEFRRRLLEGEAGGRQWLERVTCAASSHGFEVKAKLGNAEPVPLEGIRVEVVPVELEFHPGREKDRRQSSSVALIELLWDLESFGDAQQVKGLLLQGSGQGMEKARLTTRLWVVPPAP